MKNAKRLVGVALMFTVCMGSAFAEHRVNKKKKITVTVEQDGNCSQGISVSGDALGGQQMCADAPQGVGDRFQRYVGTEVEIEASWAFTGNPKSDAPVALGKVYRIGKEKVNDPCALGKLGFMATMTMVYNGADPNSTVASLTPDCQTGAPAGDDDGQ